jgi:hypothetical protein
VPRTKSAGGGSIPSRRTNVSGRPAYTYTCPRCSFLHRHVVSGRQAVLLLGQRVRVVLLHGAACLVTYPVANNAGEGDADDEARYDDTPGD